MPINVLKFRVLCNIQKHRCFRKKIPLLTQVEFYSKKLSFKGLFLDPFFFFLKVKVGS